MRYFLIAILAIHAIAHLVGFVVPWRLMTTSEMPYRTTILQGRADLGEWGIRLYGLGWLALAVASATVAAGVALRSSWWLLAAEALVFFSLLFCVLGWPETRFGVLANLIVLLGAFAVIRTGGEGVAIRNRDLERLWTSVPAGSNRPFDSDRVVALPHPARRFLDHVIAPGTPSAQAVRLKMHGEIKLGRWYPFWAEQVITDSDQFVWAATVSMFGVPVRGSDHLLNGEGSMMWKLLDAFPVMAASGADTTRSAFGRLHAEQVHWLPFIPLAGRRSWNSSSPDHLRIHLEHPIRSSEVEVALDDQGRPKSAKLSRWGDPDGKGNREVDFGVIIEQERTFQGVTIPSRVRAGWFIGSERFSTEGEFFRATVDDAEFK